MPLLFRAIGSLLLAMAASFALTACSSGVSGLPTVAATTPGEYRVDAGDKLRIAVQDLPTASADYVVDDGGSISLPMVKDVTVRGLTYRQIETAIEAAYQASGILNSPVVNVQPLDLRPFYVMGEVKNPGEFTYRHGMTVLAALSAAGGYTYRAKTGEVSLTRTVDGREVTGKAEETTPILPGDRIRVYERWF